jgi:hypothetical protein
MKIGKNLKCDAFEDEAKCQKVKDTFRGIADPGSVKADDRGILTRMYEDLGPGGTILTFLGSTAFVCWGFGFFTPLGQATLEMLRGNSSRLYLRTIREDTGWKPTRAFKRAFKKLMKENEREVQKENAREKLDQINARLKDKLQELIEKFGGPKDPPSMAGGGEMARGSAAFADGEVAPAKFAANASPARTVSVDAPKYAPYTSIETDSLDALNVRAPKPAPSTIKIYSSSFTPSTPVDSIYVGTLAEAGAMNAANLSLRESAFAPTFSPATAGAARCLGIFGFAIELFKSGMDSREKNPFYKGSFLDGAEQFNKNSNEYFQKVLFGPRRSELEKMMDLGI